MSDSQLLTVIGISAVVMAVATVVIAVCAISATRSIRDLVQRTGALIAQWESVTGDIGRAVNAFSQQSGELITRLSGLAANLQEQADRVDGALDEIVSTLKCTTRDVEATVQKTLRQFEEMTDSLDRAVRLPLTKLRAFGEAISAILRHLRRDKRPDPDRIPNDEERFI